MEGELLLLSLLGIKNNAPPRAWDFLTVRDRMQLLLVSKAVKDNLKEVEYIHCRDGYLYRIPFPGFPGLLQTSSENSGLFPHQLSSLQAMYKAENSETQYGALRGGILADAPGLGKTITMLALITSTAGRRPISPPEFWNPDQISQGWKTLTRTSHFERDIRLALKPFRALHELHEALAEDVRPPHDPPDRFPTIQDFERYVRQKLKGFATESELEQFRQNMLNLRAGLDKSHRKIMKSPAGRRKAWERSLIPTSATLLIVPDALLEHWFQQIHQHLNRSLFADENETNVGTDQDDEEDGANIRNEQGRGVVYIDGVGDIVDARMPLGNTSVESMPIPAPWVLSKYLIVVTTFSRCELEFRKEVAAGRMEAGSSGNRGKNGKRKQRQVDGDDSSLAGYYNSNGSLASPFLRMRWLRIAVDEGHELSNHDSSNSLTRFVNQMAAERRWVVSGTPTTGDEDDTTFLSKALDQLQRLLLFLRHPNYGTYPHVEPPSPYVDSGTNDDTIQRAEQKEQAKEKWVTQVKEPFLKKEPKGREELLNVLRSVVVMHRKEDIHLPKPIFRQIEVTVPIPEAQQKKLREYPPESAVLLDEYLHTDEFQSLVDEAQGTYIIQAVRKAKEDLTARGGPVRVNDKTALQMLSAEDVDRDRGDDDACALANDRRPIKAVVYSSQKYNLRDVTETFYKALDRQNIAEAYFDDQKYCPSELSRFRHDQRESRTCPICGFSNDVVDNSSQNQRRGREPQCQNRLMEVVCQVNPSIRFLIEVERVTRSVPVIEGGNVPIDRLQGLNHSQYCLLTAKDWEVGDILEVDIRDPHPLLKPRESFETWVEYGADKCQELAERYHFLGPDWFFGPLPAAVGNNTFAAEGDNPSRSTMQVFLAKWQLCSNFHGPGRWYKGPRLAQEPAETIEEDVFVLALDAGLSHGLDLSFVTHIFLLESIEDAAVLEQITSRAHRLGASGPVIVETVHPFYELDEATEAMVKKSKNYSAASITEKSSKPGESAGFSKESRKEALTRVVCQYCFRPFHSYEQAVDHERSYCSRNPANAAIVDPWRLSSVYREIRPPPPSVASGRN